jgi:hypothetical protein
MKGTKYGESSHCLNPLQNPHTATKPNHKELRHLAAIPTAGFAFAADSTLDTVTGDGTAAAGSCAGGIAEVGNFTLASLSMAKSGVGLGYYSTTVVAGDSRPEPIPCSHNE